MKKNKDLLEVLESLEKKIELKNPEHISNLAITHNSAFSGIDMCANILMFMGIFMLIKNSPACAGEDFSTPSIIDFDLTGLLNSGSTFYGLGVGVYEFVFCLFFIAMLLTGKSAYDEGHKDVNSIEHIKKSLKILNLKDYELKNLTLKNVQLLKNILEQQDISIPVDEKRIIFEFLFEMHKMFS